MKYPSPLSLKAFSIIELMVGIFIFTLGLLSVYMLLISSLTANTYNRNAIIASNLAREQIEIFRNIRDTNYKQLQVWKQQNPKENFNFGTTKLFSTGSYYTLENNFTSPSSFVDITDITSGFEEGEDKIGGTSMSKYRLCTNSNGLYVYCNSLSPSDRIFTPFYRFLYLQEFKDQNNTIIPDAFHVTSKVIWNMKGYHEYEIKTILTDWRRI